MKRRLVRLLAMGLLAVAVSMPALAAPVLMVPFPCEQSWSGQTRTNHSPACRAADRATAPTASTEHA
ncbi:hypothetical protein [Micromonospora sp. NPDC049240]|uniref:hypothetical protein n=1 Tax=Micromonospora sp. NPDC049240 TaxID=3155151 RepID=UPI0033EE4077